MLLFLDFDGVTHVDGALDVDHFKCNSFIEGVLRLHPKVDVVFSTTWRDDHTLDELRSFFSEDLRARFIGVTPSLFKGPAKRDREPKFEREWEILSWVKTNRPLASFLAIDDRPKWFSPDCPWLMQTNPRLGFTCGDAQELDRRLKAMAS